ncbi:MAG: amidohydrolase family protein, partial [Candidatus Brocadiales bacterium]|nr:amidohydrolase family protein [Candidatus Brocadiales bacterium]
CMMDKGDNVPEPLLEKTQDSIEESLKLFKRWHNKSNERIRYAFSPRFALSCSEELLRDVGTIAIENKTIVHTHAAETQQEVETLLKQTGMRNIEYLEHLNLTHENLCLAHCVWLNDNELDIIKKGKVKVLHCPNSNLKLGSGVARISDMIYNSINVSIGVDAALFNANMDIFTEMRRAISLQTQKTLSPEQTFKMATIEGAKALGLEREIGSIEVGKKADIVILNNPRLGNEDMLLTMLNFTEPSDVETVLIDGRIILKNREFLSVDENEIIQASHTETKKLVSRAEKFGFK